MRRIPIAVALFALFGAGQAPAETSGVSPTGFTVIYARDVNATPAALWTALTKVENWWSSGHTFSGKASNLSFDLRAGGCWCERWDGASVMHGTLAFIQEGRVLRFYANLGPLQDRATNGVLTFLIGTKEKTALRVTYKVAGPADAGLQELAGPVDQVIGEQVKRLVALAETGKAD